MTTKKEWIKLCRKWKKLLLLDEWDILYTYDLDNKDGIIAKTTTMTHYIYAIIDINLEILSRTSKKETDKICCHEHMHIYLDRYSAFVQAIRESMPNKQHVDFLNLCHGSVMEETVERIARVIYKLAPKT